MHWFLLMLLLKFDHAFVKILQDVYFSRRKFSAFNKTELYASSKNTSYVNILNHLENNSILTKLSHWILPWNTTTAHDLANYEYGTQIYMAILDFSRRSILYHIKSSYINWSSMASLVTSTTDSRTSLQIGEWKLLWRERNQIRHHSTPVYHRAQSLAPCFPSATSTTYLIQLSPRSAYLQMIVYFTAPSEVARTMKSYKTWII